MEPASKRLSAVFALDGSVYCEKLLGSRSFPLHTGVCGLFGHDAVFVPIGSRVF